MTTAPVMTITEELLAELELHARQAVCDAITDGFPYDPRIGLTTIEENFCAAANPSTLLALLAHIRSLEARLEKAEKNSDRYLFIASTCSVKLDGVEVEDESQIDAAIAQEGSHE